METLVRSILNPVVRIKKEEWARTLLMFFYFFLTITSYYILKPVRDSAFIHEYGAENLPYAWLLTIVILPLFVAAYVKFVDFLEKNVLLSSTLIFFIINLVIFWWFSRFHFRWLYGIFFIWVSIFSVMTVTQFWLYANDLFNPREAKRLYGVVGSGGILGGITGGVLTNRLAPAIGTANLMLVAAFLLLFCVLLINALWEVARDRNTLFATLAEKEQEEKKYGIRKSLRIIFGKKYLLMLVALICVTKIVSTLVDYQFKNIVQDSFTVLDLRTAFFGKFFAWLNTFSFCVQFFLTSFVLRRFGVGVALLLLPIGLALGSVSILVNPLLWCAALTMLYDGSMNYSLNQSTKEVLYLPVAREIRYRVKPFIDMFAYRIAKAVGSILILFSVKFVHFNERSLSIVSIALIALWIFVVRAMQKDYVNELRSFLARKLPEKEEKQVLKSKTELLENFLREISKERIGEVALALRLYNLASEPSFVPYLRQEINRPLEELREKLWDCVKHSGSLSLGGEIEQFFKRASLDEAGGILEFLSGAKEPEAEEAGRAILDPYCEIARACRNILSGDAGEGVRFFREGFEGKEDVERERMNSIVARLIEAQPKLALARDSLIQILSALSSGGRHQEGAFRDASEVLQHQGILPVALAVLAEDPLLPAIYRRGLPYLFLSSGHSDVTIFLYRMLTEKDNLTRDHAIDALVEIKLRSPERFFECGHIYDEIKKEIDEAWRVKKIIKGYKKFRSREKPPSEDPGKLFLCAQEDRYSETVGRIFYLLSLLVEPQDIQIIFHSLRDPNELVKANALEFLDNIVSEPGIKQEILKLLESESGFEEPEEERPLASFNLAPDEEENLLEELFEATEAWYFLSLACFTVKFQMKRFYPRFSLLTVSPDPFIRSLSRLICAHLGSSFEIKS